MAAKGMNTPIRQVSTHKKDTMKQTWVMSKAFSGESDASHKQEAWRSAHGTEGDI